MKAFKSRKRKTENTDESKGDKVPKSELENDGTFTSKYFGANKKPSKVQLKKNAKDKSEKKVVGDRADTDVSERKKVDTEVPEGIDKAASSASKADISSKANPGDRLDFKFYDRPCEDLAKSLLGQVLVMKYEGKRLAGKIVETEAYLGPIDKAAHSSKGKTGRNEAMFMKPGTAYVYNIYGMYCCMNISAQGDGAAVLLRALQPIENLEVMDKLRTKGKNGNSLLKKGGVGLCNGPSKLCQALGITKDAVNKEDMCASDDIWVEKGETVDDSKMVKCKRININYAEEWVDKPLRFYILGNVFNSVKDKEVEKAMMA